MTDLIESADRRREGGRRDGRTAVRLAACALCAASWPVLAGDWTITPRFSISETYTDNVGLSSTDPESDFITQLSPGLSVTGKGRRLVANINYTMQNYLYANNSGANSTNHALQADTTAELVERIVFLDVSSTISQQLIDRTATFSESSVNLTGNTADVITYRVSPYVKHHLGNYADALARYEYSVVDNSDNSRRVDGGTGADRTLNGTETTALTFNLTSGTRFSRFPWQFDVSDRSEDNDTGTSADFRRIAFSPSYRINRIWRLNATVGDEDNEYESTQRSQGGFFWTTGATWTPSERTVVTGAFGDRYFGTTYSFDATHRSRRMVYAIRYAEDVDTSAAQQGRQRFIRTVDEFGNPVFDPIDASDPRLNPDNPAITDEVFINKTFDASAAYAGRRDNVTVSYANRVREFQVRGGEETSDTLRMSWNRRLSPALTAGIVGSYGTSTLSDESGDDQRIQIGPTLSYRIARSLFSSLSYTYAENSSDSGNRDYSENRVVGTLVVTF